MLKSPGSQGWSREYDALPIVGCVLYATDTYSMFAISTWRRIAENGSEEALGLERPFHGNKCLRALACKTFEGPVIPLLLPMTRMSSKSSSAQYFSGTEGEGCAFSAFPRRETQARSDLAFAAWSWLTLRKSRMHSPRPHLRKCRMYPSLPNAVSTLCRAYLSGWRR